MTYHPPTQDVTSRVISLRFLSVVVVVCAALVTLPARADHAAADALFAEGRALIKAGKIAEAYAKFGQSLKLDRSLGTLLNYAASAEHLGLTATAWESFGAAATIARERGQLDRAKYAEQHQQAVEANLSQVVFVIEEASPDLVLVLDGTTLNREALAAGLPLDPGSHELVASASGRQARTVSVSVPPGPSKTTITLESLEPVAVVQKPPSTAPPVARPAAIEPPIDALEPEPIEPAGSSGPPVGTWVAWGGGAAAALVGAVTGGLSLSLSSELDDACPNGACEAERLEDVDIAYTLANVSNVMLVVAGAGVITGGLIWGLSADESGDTTGLVITPSGAWLRRTF